MKKLSVAMALVLSIGLLCSCGNSADGTSSEAEIPTETSAPEENIDYDLTTMSSTMIFSTVSNMTNATAGNLRIIFSMSSWERSE